MRMGHPSKNVLKHIEANTNGFTPKLEFPNSNRICPGCVQGKMHNKSFLPSMKCALKPSHLIHADLVEVPILSYHKYKWACMLLDDYSSSAYCYLLQSKSDTITAVEKFFTHVQNQHDTVIKQFCSNQGGEFTSKKFNELLSSKGIVRQTSAPHIHQQNGRAESLNNTIL